MSFMKGTHDAIPASVSNHSSRMSNTRGILWAMKVYGFSFEVDTSRRKLTTAMSISVNFMNVQDHIDYISATRMEKGNWNNLQGTINIQMTDFACPCMAKLWNAVSGRAIENKNTDHPAL
jgi:hypothetical protein